MSASDEIRDAIARAGGAIPFERFMELALYGPSGFYVAGGAAGRRGDFLTSPEVGPLFGMLIGRYLDAEWERLGRPDPFTFVDAGAGPGTLARSVLAAQPACLPSLRYVAVELADAQQDRHPPEVDSRRQLPSETIDGVVLANELLDNLPFRLAVHDHGWREAYVAAEGGRFVEVLSAPFDPCPPALPDAPHGARAPLIEQAEKWVVEARRVVRSGSVLAIDYTCEITADVATRPWREWLRTYRRHQRGEHYLAEPGEQDLTTDVPLDQLPPPDRRWSQADFLADLGIGALVDDGQRAWEAAAGRPDVAALAMRSRRREAEALTDASGLGAYSVLEWRSAHLGGVSLESETTATQKVE